MRRLTNLVAIVLLSSSTLFANNSSDENRFPTDSISAHELAEVNVNAFRTNVNRQDIPYSVTVLTAKDIKSIPSENVSTLLKKSGLVDVIEYQGFKTSVGMRGFSPSAHNQNYTATYINGVPVGTTNLSVIDIAAAQGVEVLRGPFSSFYGSGAMGGVINIVTPKSKGDINGSVDASAGSFNTYKIGGNIGGAISDKFNFDANVKVALRNSPYTIGENNILKTTEIEKLILDSATYGATFNNSEYELYKGGYRVGYNIEDNITLNLYQNLSFAKDIYLNGNFWGSYGSQIEDITNTNQSLHFAALFGKHSIKVAPFYNSELTEYYSDTSDDRYLESSSRVKNYGFVAQDQYQFNSHSIVVGVDNTTDRYSSERWSDETVSLAPYSPNNSSSKTGVYAQLSLNMLNNQLGVMAGVRYDNIALKVEETEHLDGEAGDENHNTFNPNIGIQYRVTENLRVKGSVGSGFLAPDAFQKVGSYAGYYTYRGNPDLKPESSVSYDFGFDYIDPSSGIEFGATYFITDLDDKIGYDYSNADYVTYLNADNAEMDGIEVNLALDFGQLFSKSYSLKLYGNLTHLIKSELTSGDVTSDILYVREGNGSMGVSFDDKKALSTRLNARYIGHRYSADYLSYGNRPELYEMNIPFLEHPDALVFDFSIDYNIAKKYRVGIQVENLFDENYTEKDGYNMPGRSFSASIGYIF